MLPKQTKIVVIGGGVLGTSAAFQLADAGHTDVVILDRGALASGTTPFAAGQTSYLSTDKVALEFGTYCIEFFENFEAKTGHAIDFHQVGSMRIALTEKYVPDLQGRIDAAKSICHEVELVDPARASQMVPTLDLNDAAGILVIPRDGWVEPKSVAVAYAAAARDRGVFIATGIEATGVTVTDGAVKAVTTSQGTIETEWVVLAAGAWTRQFGQQLGLNLKTVPVRHQAYVTAPTTGVSIDQPVVRVVEPQLYVRPDAGGGLLIGGYGYRPLSFDMNDFPGDFEIPALPADHIYLDQLAEAASRFFPVLRDSVVIQERRGLPTMSPDGERIVSEVAEVRGLIVTSACIVGGIHYSPGMGRIVADIVSDTSDWLPASRLKADRFADDLNDEIRLRSRCEETYAHQYHELLY